MSTIHVPAVVPTANRDCLELHRAFQGLGCDSKKVIEILGQRTLSQRSPLGAVYKNMFQEELLERLKSELYRNMRKAMLLWMYDPTERDASILNETLTVRGGKDVCPLIEIMSSRTANELQSISKAYYTKYSRSLEKDIRSAMNGSSLKLFLEYLGSARVATGAEVDLLLAQKEAEELYNAGEGRKVIDEATFIRILTSRTREQLCSTFDAYIQLYGHPIQKALKKEHGGEFQNTLRGVTKCIQYPDKYFAKVLYKSMKGLGTDDMTLIRVVVTRAEIDMRNIKSQFVRKYRTSLERMISSDTSGNYRRFLVTLVGSSSRQQ